MRLECRLQRLERRARSVGSARCGECGAPVPGMNLYMAVGDDGEPLWGRCGACGLALDERGRPCAPFPVADGVPAATKVYHAQTSIGAV